jgi:hypothetical protein
MIPPQDADGKQTRQHSRRQSALLNKVSGLLHQTTAAYPSQTVEPDTYQIWLTDWMEIARKHGFEMLEAAVVRHRLTGNGFIPLASDLSVLIPQIKSENAGKAVKARPKFQACDKIVNGGQGNGGEECKEGMWFHWAVVSDSQGNPMYDGKPVKRCRMCDCLKEWKRSCGLAAQPSIIDRQ